MTTYTPLPAFRDGDLLSASRLNTVASNIDVAVGLDEQRVWPVEAGANVKNCDIYSRARDARYNGKEVEYYIAHNGDRLMFKHLASGFAGNATLTYNNQTWTGLAHNTDHALTLSDLPRYKIVKVRIVGDDPDRLFVRKLYAYDSNAAAIGSMPAFSDGTASSAAHLNTIMQGTQRAIAQLNQPIAGMLSLNRLGQAEQLTRDRNGYYGYIRHRHDLLYLEVSYGCDGFTEGDRMYLTYNGTEVWSWAPTTNNYFGTFASNVAIPSGLSIGTWYPVEFRMDFSSDKRQRFSLWSLYETPTTAGGVVGAVDRWEHGDTVEGDGGSAPQLASMSAALGGITSPLTWTNPACRAGTGWIPNNAGDCSTDTEIVDEMASVRVHKWLAYENILKANGSRAPVTLLYRTGSGYTFTGISLPSVTTPSFYDLDTTPIKPGAYFRVVGSKFLIQTPGYEGE